MEGRVDLDGVTLAYTLAGEGPPVVLLHGWTCHRGFWRALLTDLASDHRVLALDFRGHSESSVPQEGYSLEQLAEDVHHALQRLGHSPAVVVGHSMGGMTAQRLALDYPQDAKGLVLVATTAADPNDTMISVRIAEETPRLGYRDAFLERFGGWFLPQSDPQVVAWARDEMLKTPEHVALGMARAYRRLDLRDALPRIQAPTLVIGARGDASTPVTSSEEIARLIPGAQLVTISGTGHFVQLERPREVTQAVRAFLAKHGL